MTSRSKKPRKTTRADAYPEIDDQIRALAKRLTRLELRNRAGLPMPAADALQEIDRQIKSLWMHERNASASCAAAVARVERAKQDLQNLISGSMIAELNAAMAEVRKLRAEAQAISTSAIASGECGHCGRSCGCDA